VCPSSIRCYVGISTAVAVVEPAISTDVLSLRRGVRRISRVVVCEPVAHGCILILRPCEDVTETRTRSVRNCRCGVVLVHSHFRILAVARDICADCGRADGEDVGAVVPSGRREDGRVAGGVVETPVGIVVAAGVEGDAVVAGGEDRCCSWGVRVSTTPRRKTKDNGHSPCNPSFIHSLHCLST